MTKKLFSIAMILVLALSAFGAYSGAQASARTANWVVSVTYQNVGNAATSVTVNFYAEGDSTPVAFDPLDGALLNPGAGRSFFIGDVAGLGDGFTGNAVISAEQPLVATVVQRALDTGFYMRLLSNGFQSADGSTQYLIATALYSAFSRTTVFSVQNTGSSDVTATFNFYDADANGSLASSPQHVIKGNSSKFIEMDNVADTGLIGRTTFNGSAIVTVPSGNAIVAAASELYTNRNVAANFEGIPLSRAANTVYMATAICNTFNLKTAYAVQNASTSNSASITVTYYNLSGTQVATDGPYTLQHGEKASILTCHPSDGHNMNGFTGSAKIVSTGAPIAVIGKASCSEVCPAGYQDVFTAFLGEPLRPSSSLAAPFVRWVTDARFNSATNTGAAQRSTLAVQNLESTEIKVNVKYFGKDGGLPLATETLTIPGLSKGNSSPATAGALGLGGMNAGEFGYYPGGLFGGSVIIEPHPDTPTARFLAIVRCRIPRAAEDYNAVPVAAQ